MFRIVCSHSLRSLRFVSSITTPIGIPPASVITLRLTPSLPRSVGLLPVTPPPSGLFHQIIDRHKRPIESNLSTVVSQRPGAQLVEEPGLCPLLKAAVRDRARIDPGRLQRTPTSETMDLQRRRDQRHDPFPHRVRDPERTNHRHPPVNGLVLQSIIPGRLRLIGISLHDRPDTPPTSNHLQQWELRQALNPFQMSLRVIRHVFREIPHYMCI
jgi:hypothetical protein